jgi:hypothetical protein
MANIHKLAKRPWRKFTIYIACLAKGYAAKLEKG